MLPQYRNDRKIKKEKYDECLRLIQELIDCDDFEDISTLRVSIVESESKQTYFILSTNRKEHLIKQGD